MTIIISTIPRTCFSFCTKKTLWKKNSPIKILYSQCFSVNADTFYESGFNKGNSWSENTFSHGLLERKPLYKDILQPFQKYEHRKAIGLGDNNIQELLKNADWSNLPNDQLCSLFETISNISLSPITADCYNDLRQSIIIHSKEMTDEQLAFILKCLTKWPYVDISKRETFREFWKQLDEVCISRWKEWSPKKILYFVDLFYTLKLTRRSDFIYVTMSKFIKKPLVLSPQEIVLVLFYINVLRTITKKISMYELEHRLEECLQELTIEEIGIAVMGFFKTENSLHGEKLMEYIIDKTVNEIRSVHEITLTCILKALRRSISIPIWPKVPKLLDAIEGEIPRLSVKCCAQSSLLTTKIQLIHENLLSRVSQKIVENIRTCRLKDMEKAVFPLVQMTYDPGTKPDIYYTIVDELTRKERYSETMKFPKAFIALVHYLCIKGVYAEHLIQRVLDMEFVQHAYGKYKYMYGREVLYIDTVVELECRSYLGPRLPLAVRNYLSKRYSEYTPDRNGTRKLHRHQQWHCEIIETAETLFGKGFTTVKYLLPNHPRADIIVRLDDSYNPLHLPDSLVNYEEYTGPIKAPGNNYFALVVGSKNMFLHNSKNPNGETVSKLKQLKLLGFTPVMVSCDDWPNITNLAEKLQHLRTLIIFANS